MSTNLQIVSDALAELGLVAEGESATAAQGSDALRILNQMMADWAVSDKDFHFPPQDTLSATSPIPPWAEQGVTANLAVNCASKFRAPITEALAIRAKNGADTIARTLMNLKLEPADMSHLPIGEEGYRWNIETDL